MGKKRPQAWIWFMQPYNYIYLATCEFIMDFDSPIKNLVIATVEPVYYGHLGTNQVSRLSRFLIFQVNLYDKASLNFGVLYSYGTHQLQLKHETHVPCVC